MTIFFTADQHFFHTNILKYCNRPFPTIEAMNTTLINNWNKVVYSKDTVYILGDFCWVASEVSGIVKALSGTKVFLRGNHDKFPSHWDVRDVLEIKTPTKIWLSHYPHESWPSSYHDSYHLHGHCHGNLPDNPLLLRHDVGVDANNYTPVSLEQLMKIMEEKKKLRASAPNLVRT